MFETKIIDSNAHSGLFMEITLGQDIMLVDLMDIKSGDTKADTVTRLAVETIKDAIFIANKLDIPFKING